MPLEQNYRHCRIFRSSISRGKIDAILVDSKFSSTGAQFFQWKDIPWKFHVLGESLPLLAEDEVYYRGQPIALLLAESEDLLELSAGMIHVRFRESPTPGITAETYPKTHSVTYPKTYTDEAQIVRTAEKIQGDPDRAWRKTAENGGVHTRITTRHTTNACDERERRHLTAAAHWSGTADNTMLTITAPVAWPHLIIKNLKSRISPQKLCVVSTDTPPDSAFIDSHLIALYAAISAILSGKNTLLSVPPQEQAFTQCPSVQTSFTIGIGEDAAAQVADITMDVNAGAFCIFSDEVIHQAVSAVQEFYGVENWKLVMRLFTSSSPPVNVFRGMPLLQVPLEIQANHIAKIMDRNPLIWRREHMPKIPARRAPPRHASPRRRGRRTAADTSDGDSADLLNVLDTLSDYTRRYSAYELLRKQRNRQRTQSAQRTESVPVTQLLPNTQVLLKENFGGIGLAYGFQAGGFSSSVEKRMKSRVRVEMHGDGTVHAYVNVRNAPIINWLRQIIVDELGIKPENTVFNTEDCREIPDGGPEFDLRSFTVIAEIFRRACIRLQKQRFHNPLPLSVSTVFRGGREWDEQTLSGNPFIYRHHGAAALELEFDALTYIPHIKQIWMVVNAAPFPDRQRAISALEGHVLNCLNSAVNGISENVEICGGSSRSSLRESRIVPRITIIFTNLSGMGRETCSTFKELAQALIPPAYLSALSQASDTACTDIPCGSRQIFSYIHHHSEQQRMDNEGSAHAR